MTPRRLLLLAGLAVVAVLLLKIYFSEERVIARRLKSAAAAFEAEKILPLATHFSRRYSDERGNDYETILAFAHRAFQSYDDPAVSLSISSIQITGQSATVEVSFFITATADGQRTRLVGTRTDPATALLELTDEHGTWKISGATAVRARHPP